MSVELSGWRKRQIALDIKAENARELGLNYEPDKTVIEMAHEAGFLAFKYPALIDKEDLKKLESFAALVREDALAQPAPYMAVSTDRMSVDPHTGNVSIGTVAQPEERNFCSRCGKRTRDLTTIHTCTPPQENT